MSWKNGEHMEIPKEVREYYSKIGKKGNANRTYEQRQASARKGAETRKRNAKRI